MVGRIAILKSWIAEVLYMYLTLCNAPGNVTVSGSGA